MKKIALLLTSILWSLSCEAHGVADNHLQIMVIDDRIKMSITVDMRVLQTVDEDGDGYASLSELNQHGEDLRAWVRKSFAITDKAGDAGEVVFTDVTSDLNIARDHGDRVDHARILQTLQFSTEPQEMRLNLAALATLVPELRVTIIDGSTGLTYRLLDPMRRQSVPMPEPQN
ncbi:MAG: hypothetical protein GY783_00720 [Gammaproteobacteria bacterium]|nr:hypothetical protein [Gammaproteobacteria bacterium]